MARKRSLYQERGNHIVPYQHHHAGEHHCRRGGQADAPGAVGLRAHMGEKVYETIIPRNVRVSEAPSYGKPAILYDLKCAGSQAYLQLASEVIRRERRLRAA